MEWMSALERAIVDETLRPFETCSVRFCSNEPLESEPKSRLARRGRLFSHLCESHAFEELMRTHG